MKVTIEVLEADRSLLRDELKHTKKQLSELYGPADEWRKVGGRQGVKVQNRFALLADKLSEDDATSDPTCKVISVEETPRSSKTKGSAKGAPSKANRPVDLSQTPRVSKKSSPPKRLFIVSDSQGRDITKHLQPLVKNTHEVCAFVRPGASFETVLSMAEQIVADTSMTKADHLIVFGGSNDIGRGKGPIDYSSGSLLDLSSKTNLIFAAIPPRFDLPIHYEEDVCRANKRIKEDLEQSDAQYISEYSRHHFTRHGLHFNAKGKSMLAFKIEKLVTNTPFLDI